MPGTTPRLALPYPVPDDTVDVPRDVKALADKIDTLPEVGIAPYGALVLTAPASPTDAGVGGWQNVGTVGTWTEVNDSYNWWTSGPYVNIGMDGYYLFNGYAEWTGTNSTGQRAARIVINSLIPNNMGQTLHPANTGGSATRNLAWMQRKLVAGDQVSFQVWQSSGAPLQLNAASLSWAYLSDVP